jgi:hypothetical protein
MHGSVDSTRRHVTSPCAARRLCIWRWRVLIGAEAAAAGETIAYQGGDIPWPGQGALTGLPRFHSKHRAGAAKTAALSGGEAHGPWTTCSPRMAWLV